MDDPAAKDVRPSTGVGLTVTRPRDSFPATVSVRATRVGPWTILVVEGELDFQVVPLLADLPDGEAGLVVFDLRGVTFMDAGGLGAIIRSQQKARQAGGCVRIVAPSAWARRIFMLTGTDKTFRSFLSLDAAVSTPILTPSTMAP